MALYFKINFLNPGHAFPKDNQVYRLKRRLFSTQKDLSKKLLQDIGTNITLLVIGSLLLIIGDIFFYVGVYVPRNKTLAQLAEEIKTLDREVSQYKQVRAQEEERRSLIRNRINQLTSLKQDVLPWTEKLKAINRNLVPGLWLTSLEVRNTSLNAPAKANPAEGGGGGEKPLSPPTGGSPQAVPSSVLSPMGVIIAGSTYNLPGTKPLKVISQFMASLMNDPIWEKQFDLKDWTVTSVMEPIQEAEAEEKAEEAPVKGAAKGKKAEPEENKEKKTVERINFVLELERKR